MSGTDNDPLVAFRNSEYRNQHPELDVPDIEYVDPLATMLRLLVDGKAFSELLAPDVLPVVMHAVR